MKFCFLIHLSLIIGSTRQDNVDIADLQRSTNGSHYVLVAPGTLLAGSSNRLCVSRLGRATEGAARIQLDVLPANSTANNQSYIARVRKNFSQGNGGCFDMVIPKTPYTRVNLHLRIRFDSLPDYEVQTSRAARVLSEAGLVVIQTDRPLYRAGDTVRFRLLHLKPDLLPIHAPVRRVWVEPPPVLWTGRARAAQWEGLHVQLGLAQLQYVLDEQAPKGEWSIHVETDESGGESAVVTFVVADYSLPSFYLTVHHPPRVLRTAPRITYSICARYMWGEGVRGVLQVRVHGDGGAAPVRFSARLYGQPCHNHTLDARRLGFIAAGSDEPTMIIGDISFQEESTRMWRNTSVISRFVEETVKIEFINKNKMYLSPGLPYKTKIRLTDWNEDPLAMVAVQICRIATNSSEDHDPDENSIVGKEHHEQITEPCDNIHTDTRGYAQASFNVPIALNAKYYKFRATARTTRAHQVLNIRAGERIHAALGALGSGGLRNHVSLYLSYPPHREVTAPTVHFMLVTRGGIIFRWGAITQCPQSISAPLSSRQIARPDMHCLHPPSARTLLRLALPARVSHQMCPYSHLLVYFYHDGELVVTAKHFKVSECFYNKVVAHWTPSTVPPGSPVRLSITSLGPALCATSVSDLALRHTLPAAAAATSLQTELMNKLRLFMETRKNITLGDLPQRSCLVDKLDGSGLTPEDFEYLQSTFSTSGVRLFTDLLPELTCKSDDQPEHLEQSSNPTPNERSHFPESWLWNLHLLPSNGSLDLDVTAPDSITRFETAVTCMSRSGVSVAQPAFLKVFQPFFVELEVPRKIKRGEQTQFFYKIFNYLEESLAVTVDVETDADSGITIRGVSGSTPGSHTICVGIHDTYSVRLGVVGMRLGTWRLVARVAVLAHMQHYCGGDAAQNVYPSDKIVKEILVEPEGQLVEKHHSSTLCTEGEGEYGATEVEWRWEGHDRMVPGSERWSLWVIGDLAGPINLNADKLLTLPLGCGEQNMARLAYNLVALKHLELSGEVDQELKDTALSNIVSGYARQMRYTHPSGGFSAFGAQDDRPSTWLTAFCTRYLRIARRLLPQDDANTKLATAEDWLVSLQMENGCFQNIGQVFHREFKGGLDSETTNIALSAYVMVSLIEAGTILRPSVVQSASYCLEALHRSRGPPNYAYTLALVAYAQTRLERYETEIRERNDINLKMKSSKDAQKKGWKSLEQPGVKFRYGNESSIEKYGSPERNLKSKEDLKAAFIKDPKEDKSVVEDARHARKGENWTGAAFALGSLRRIARRSGDLVWWEAESLATTIETTSYAVLALLAGRKQRQTYPELSGAGREEVELEDAAGAVRWLSLHRNSAGGFISTQDTLVALEAIAAWSTATAHIPPLLEVTVAGPGLVHQLTVTPRTRHVLHAMTTRAQDLREPLRVRAQGSGCILVQATQQYHTLETSPRSTSPFLLQPKVQSDGTFDCQNNTWCRCAAVLEVCVSWVGNDFPEMAILEVELPTGYVIDKTLLYGLLSNENILLRRLEEYESDSRVVFYLAVEGSYRGGRPQECYQLYLMGPQSRTAPAYVKVYDYYHPEINNTKIYTVPESCPGPITHPEPSNLGSDNLYRHLEDRARYLNTNENTENHSSSAEAHPSSSSHETIEEGSSFRSEMIAVPSYANPRINLAPVPSISTPNVSDTTKAVSDLSLSGISSESTEDDSGFSERPMESNPPYQTLFTAETTITPNSAPNLNSDPSEPPLEEPGTPTQNPELVSQGPFENFHVIDSDMDLAVPDGIEGPVPDVVAAPAHFVWNEDVRDLSATVQEKAEISSSLPSSDCPDRFANWTDVTHDLEAAEAGNFAPSPRELPCQT